MYCFTEYVSQCKWWININDQSSSLKESNFETIFFSVVKSNLCYILGVDLPLNNHAHG